MNNKLNGSVGRLAEAFGDVITNAMESVRSDMRQDIQEVEERLVTRIDGLAGEVQSVKQEVRDAEERMSERIDRSIEDIVVERQADHVT